MYVDLISSVRYSRKRDWDGLNIYGSPEKKSMSQHLVSDIQKQKKKVLKKTQTLERIIRRPCIIYIKLLKINLFAKRM